MKKIVSLFLLFFFVVACGNTNNTNQTTTNPAEFILTTADEVNLTVEYHEIQGAERAVLLVHMLGHDKADYENLSIQLQENGFTVLLLDFRGHGTSDLDYTQFIDADWQNLVLDIEAGINYLEQKGYTRIGVIGASIGANAALKHAVQDTRIDALVLLSAGENYHGITTLDYALFYDRPVLVIASLDDKDAAIAATKIYNAVNTDLKEIKMYQSGGHGTDIVKNVKSADATISEWLWNNI